MSRKIIKLLGAGDPEPVTVINKPGNIIFCGPHNGLAVPKCLPPFMGTEKEWFETAHDAHDLYMDKVFDALNLAFDDASLIWGNYSRLLFDLNSMPDHAINETSAEGEIIKIPANKSDQCCITQRGERFNKIYAPYHSELTYLIHEKRAKYGGVIVLDMHSFTPIWDFEDRNIELGTIRCESTPLSRAFEEFLKEQQNDFTFTSGKPYRVADKPSNAAPLITDNNNLQYLGLEICNNLIADGKGIDKIVALLKRIMTHLNQPEFIDVTKKHNEVEDKIKSANKGELKKISEIYQSNPI